MSAKNDNEDEATDVLIPLAEYKLPSRPTTNELRAWFKKAFKLFQKDAEEPFIASDKLHHTAAALLDKIASPPAFGSLTAGLERSLREWSRADSPEKRIRVIVVPPGDDAGLIATWAEEYRHEILRAPARGEIDSGRAEVTDLEGEGLLVIPHLEYWFFRNFKGLATVRTLLEAIDRSHRKIVVSCDSWAWEYLTKAASVDLILPDPQTLRPFDGERLASWFSGLVAESGVKNLRFRESASGNDLLDNGGTDHAEKTRAGFFRELAARSRGIPWVAWSLWRGSIRLEQEEKIEFVDGHDVKPNTDESAEQQVLWVTALDEFSLPNEHRATALLVMHALLLHGALTREEIAALLPMRRARELLSALLRSRLIREQNGILACGTAAYPSIRAGLETAGFSMDKL